MGRPLRLLPGEAELRIVTALYAEALGRGAGWRVAVWHEGHEVPGVTLPARAVLRLDPVLLGSGLPAVELLVRVIPGWTDVADRLGRPVHPDDSRLLPRVGSITS